MTTRYAETRGVNLAERPVNQKLTSVDESRSTCVLRTSLIDKLIPYYENQGP